METPSVNSEKRSSDFSYAPATVIAEHYRVERELGRGGMATVYLCTDIRTDEKVAIKILRPELGSAVIIERFLREIAFASELDHPQIPKVLGSGVVDGVPYYVMSYVEGESLRRLIDREKQLPLPEALRIACEVIKPTAYAHKRGIVHRDLKPENIFISDKGIFVLDFGISRAIIESGGDRLTSTGIGVGTPAYMSPEQALGDRNLDVRTDIYSLGCVLYEMIGGLPPFVGPTAQVVISRRFAGNPPPLRELRDGVPESVEYAVERALAKSPADRWSSAEDFGSALNACATGELRFTTGSQRYWWARPNRRAAMIVLGAGVIAASAFAWSAKYREPLAQGQRAIVDWDFAKAKSDLLRATSLRNNKPRSQLWLAQAMMLNGDSAELWKPLAAGALASPDGLSENEQRAARALITFGGDQPASACAQFGTIAQSEAPHTPLRVSSNLAYADCLVKDQTVVPDSASPSGYRFKVSWQFVDSLYEAMLDQQSTSSAAYRALMPRLKRILGINRALLRLGVSQAPERMIFLAQASLAGDTIAYFPSAIKPSGPWRSIDPQGVNAATTRNRQRVRGFALAWVRVAPNEAQAHETLAEILELTGELYGGEVSALSEIHKARNLTNAGSDEFLRRVRLATADVRLNLRLSRFATASAVADTVLQWKTPSNLGEIAADSAGGFIIGLAALRGRASRVIDMEQHSAGNRLVRLPSGESMKLPLALGVDQIGLEAYSEFGGPRDTIVAIVGRMRKNAVAMLPPDKVEPIFAGLGRWMWLAAPVIGAPSAVAALAGNRDSFSRALGMAAKGNNSGAKMLLDSLANSRVGLAPGEVTIEIVYAEAWLRTQIRDTATALTQLDNVLRGLPAAPPSILISAALPASLVRAMALRATLAANAGDRENATKYANAVLQLWGTGDPIVSSTVNEMRKIVPNAPPGGTNGTH